MNNQEFLKLAAERYSVRNFSPAPIEKEKLEAILKAGHLAPTACNNQPQHIYVIESAAAMEKLKNCTPYHFGAPLALLICYDSSRSWKRSFDAQDSGFVDGSIVATHLMMAAWEQGIGSTWVMYFDPKKMAAEFDLPEHMVPVALLPMGYPGEKAQPSPSHTSFRPEEELVSYL